MPSVMEVELESSHLSGTWTSLILQKQTHERTKTKSFSWAI